MGWMENEDARRLWYGIKAGVDSTFAYVVESENEDHGGWVDVTLIRGGGGTAWRVPVDVLVVMLWREIERASALSDHAQKLRRISEQRKAALAATKNDFLIEQKSDESYNGYLKSPEWQVVRRIAHAAADHRCQLCNGTERLEVHHRTYDNVRNETLDDVIVLCRDCHSNFHGKSA